MAAELYLQSVNRLPGTPAAEAASAERSMAGGEIKVWSAFYGT